MFFINEAPHDYTDPWNIPLEARFTQLCQRKIRVAYFYEKPDTSTFRYRVYNMIQALQALDSEVGGMFFHNDDARHFRRIVDAADVIVICRMRYDERLNELATRARAQGKQVIFDVDDLIFDVEYTHLILRTLDQEINPAALDFWYGYVGRIGSTLKQCTSAITTNAFLAHKIEKFAGIPVSIVPNFMNQEQLAISDRIYADKKSSGFARTNEITLGYFSGTPTHNHDFAMMAPAIARLMERDSRVRLLVVGFLELRSGLEKFSDRITFYPLHDFVNLQRIMSFVEINLVPLLDNEFTNCKSELKYFEAAAVGTISVATPIHSYASVIEDGVNGFLARASDWDDRLEKAIAKLDDYADIAGAAHAVTMRRYGWFNQLPCIRSALFNTIDPAIARGINPAQNVQSEVEHEPT